MAMFLFAKKGGETLSRDIQIFCLRYRVVRTFLFLQLVAFAGLSVTAGYVFLDKLIYLNGPYDLFFVFVSCAALLILLAFFLFCPRRVRHVTYLVDQRGGLKNLTASGLDVEGKKDPISLLVYGRALEAVRKQRPSSAIPLQMHWSTPYSFAPLVALFFSLILPQADLLGRRQAQEEKQRERYKVIRASVKLQKQAELLHREAEGTPSRPTAEMLQELDMVAESLEGVSPEEAFEKISTFEEDHRDLFSRTEGLKAAARALETLESELLEGLSRSSRETMKSLLASWKEGRFKEVAQGLREAASLLESGTLTPEEKTALAEKLKGMLQTLKAAEMDPRLAELLSQLDASEFSCGKCLMDAAELIDEWAAMESLRDGLAAAKRDVMGEWMDGFDMKEVEKYVEAEARLGGCCCNAGQGMGPEGMGQGGKGKGAGTGGEGQGRGGRPPEEVTDTTFEPEKDPASMGEGKILQQIAVPALAEPGQVDSEYVEVVKAARRKAASSLAREQIPAEYEDTVKTYFNSLEGERTESAVERLDE